MRRNPIYRAALAVVMAVSSTQLAAAPDAFIDLDISAGLDDNVTRAQNNRDIEHDTFVSATGTFSMPISRGRQGRLSGDASLSYQHFNEFEGLSNVTLRLGLDYVYVPKGGFGAPWYAVNASYSLKEFDSFLRDSDIYTVGGQTGFMIDDLTGFRSGLTLKIRESDGAAFDTEDVSLFVNIDWSLERAGIEFLNKTTLYTTYKIQIGDVFSTASSTTAFASGTGIYPLASSSIPKDDPDDVFGGIAYKLDSTTHIVTVGLNFKLDLQRAWDISMRVLTSDTDIGLEYEDLAITASYFHKFGLQF